MKNHRFLPIFAVALALASTLFAGPARAELRAVNFPAALRPDALNTIATSRTAPIAFVGSRDTDTLFAFDPRTGEEIGRLAVGDGPLGVELFETPDRRLVAVACDGFFGSPRNLMTIVDATDPTRMRVVGRAELPENHIFLFGFDSLRFVDGGAAVVCVATDVDTGRGLFLAYDVATGAEIGRAPIVAVPSTVDVVEHEGHTTVAIAHAVAPRGRVTIVDATVPSAPRVVAVAKLPKKSGLYNVNDVVLSEDGRHGYVASADANAFFVFETATGKIVSRTPTGSFPTRIVRTTLAGKRHVAVVAENSASVGVYDVSDEARPAVTGAYKAPVVFLDVAPALSADGGTLYAPSTDGNRIYAIDLATGTLRYQTTAGERPVSAAVWEGPTDRYVCIASERSADVTCISDVSAGYRAKLFSSATGAVQFTLYQNVVLSRDGRHAFVASKSTNELLAVDVGTGQLAGRVRVATAPSQINIAEDAAGNRRIVVLGSHDSTVTIVDAANPSAMTAKANVSLGSPLPFLLEYANVAVSGDGLYAFVADGYQFLYAIDLARGEVAATVGTGFNPITLALYESRGRRLVGVLNASFGSTSAAIVDASTPAAMTRVATADLPEDLVVALNNVPRFTADGRHLVVGASITESVFTIDVETGRIAGRAGSSVVVPAPFVDGETQMFAAVGLGTSPGGIFRIKSNGKPRSARSLDAPEGAFFLVGNDPVVASDGSWGVVPNFGRASLIAFDPRTGAVTGELPLGHGPGTAAVDGATGTVAALEVNGTASRLLLANLSDLAPPPPAKQASTAPRRRDARATGERTIGDAMQPARGAVSYISPTGDSVVWDRRSNRR